MSGSNVEEVVDSVVGNGGLMEGIRQAACATKSVVTEGVEEIQSCFTNENSLTATHGLGTGEDAYIFMLGGSVDATAWVAGASLGFGIAIELDSYPQLALYMVVLVLEYQLDGNCLVVSLLIYNLEVVWEHQQVNCPLLFLFSIDV